MPEQTRCPRGASAGARASFLGGSAALDAADKQHDADDDQKSWQRSLAEQAVVRVADPEDGSEDHERDHEDEQGDEHQDATLPEQLLIVVPPALQPYPDPAPSRRDQRPGERPYAPVLP